MKKRTWNLMLVLFIIMLAYFSFLYAGMLTDVKYGVIEHLVMGDNTIKAKEVRKTVDGYISSLSMFIVVQFLVILYLLVRIDRK